MVVAFDLFPTVFFALRLKMYDPGDRRTMRTLSDDSEGTGLIYQSRSKVMIVPISNRSIGIINGPISGMRTANFNFEVHLAPIYIGSFDCSSVLVDNIGDDSTQYHERHSHPI